MLPTAAVTSPSSTSQTPLRVRPVMTRLFWSSTRVYHRSVTSRPRRIRATSGRAERAVGLSGPAAGSSGSVAGAAASSRRCAAIGPQVRDAAEAWPVDTDPASAAELRSWVPALVTPSRISTSDSRGVPSTSNGSPGAGSPRLPSGSSISVTDGSNCSAPSSANDCRCANALPLKPNEAKLLSRSATASGSRTTSYRPGGSSTGR